MANINPFTPAGTVSQAVTSSSATVALSKGGVSQTVMVTSPAGGNIAFIKFGASTVTAALTDTPVLPGAILIFTIGNDVTHAAAIGSATTTLYFTNGQGA